MIKNKITAIGISFMLLFPQNVYAAENKDFKIDDYKTTLLTSYNILPSSDFYFLDRIMEQVTNLITFDKVDIENNLVNTGIERISELYQDKSLSIEQRQKLIADANNDIKSAIDILPDIVDSSDKNKKETIDMAYNIVSIYPKLVEEAVQHPNGADNDQFTEILLKTNDNIRNLLFDISKIKIQSNLYSPADVTDELLEKPTAYSEETKNKFKCEVDKINSNDQEVIKKVSEIEKESNGLIDYVLKETKNDINSVVLSDEKPKAKALLINTTIELSRKRMNQIFGLKKQQLEKITAEINK